MLRYQLGRRYITAYVICSASNQRGTQRRHGQSRAEESTVSVCFVYYRNMSAPHKRLKCLLCGAVCTQRAEVTLSANARSWPWFPCLELYKENGRGLSNTAVCKQGSALGSGGQTEERQQIGESRGFKKKKQRFEITSRLDVKREH